MLLAYRLVRLIETHADRLAKGLLVKLQNCEKCAAFKKVPSQEFEQRVYEIYDHLGEWLLGKKEEDVARRYTEIGKRREAQGVPMSQLIYAIMLTREHLWEYLKHEANVEKPVEVFGELEVLELLDQFFDRAMYYATQGYEKAHAARPERELTHAGR
ncbi:MAG: hypothetical protein LAN64_19985 [Acidobacteriia bacterium]|nr:hypothetical protein [Terriglobia bacterium]